MLNQINHELLFDLKSEAHEIHQTIAQYESKLDETKAKILKLLPRGYWYSCEIDPNWHQPKKYSIREICVCSNDIYITIKEVFKKLPWPGFTGKSDYSLNNFLKLKIYKTAEEAKEGYLHRICPKCGGFMMNSDHPWCSKCWSERARVINEFNDSHVFYCPSEDKNYHVEYEDEFIWQKGFCGKHFTLRRMDTGEIIYTSNLWSSRKSNDFDTLPKIEFLKDIEED